MKNLMVLAVFMVSGLANAKTFCTINGANPTQDMVYDRLLYSGEVKSGVYLSYKKGDATAHEFDLNHLSYQQWKNLNGVSIITFSPAAGGTYAITASHVDMSQSQNVDPIDAIAFSQAGGALGLTLIVPSAALSASCVTAQ